MGINENMKILMCKYELMKTKIGFNEARIISYFSKYNCDQHFLMVICCKSTSTIACGMEDQQSAAAELYFITLKVQGFTTQDDLSKK